MLTRKTLTQLLVVTILAITAKPLMAQAAYGESHPLRYRVIDVGTFGGATAQTNGSRIENNAGTVAGEADTNQPCPYAVGAPNALNNRGEVAGLSNLVGDTTTHPFLWTKAEGMNDLGTFGGTFGEATWINDAGEVIGGATLPGDQVIHAFLWKDGVKTDLGTLEGDPSSFAFGLNSKGQVVGNSGSANGTRGFLWENGKMFDLNTLVSPASKLNLNFPTIINDRGEIAGQAQLPNGDIHAFLLIPCDGDHSGERECEEETAATTTPHNTPADVSLTRMNTPQSSLTPGEIVARMRSRFGRNRPFAAFPRK